MILNQLKQLALSATRRNADVVRLARFYSSPAVCQSLTTTTKSYKRLSRDDRRAVVESFVTEYRAANAGKFPTVEATVKKVGGGYYVVRDILQELKLKPNAHLPIVATALSEIPASAPNGATSETLIDADTDPLSHSSGCDAEQVSSVVADPVFQDVSDTIDSPHPNSDESNPEGNNNLVITVAHDNRETDTINSPHPNSDESNPAGNNNLVITAAHDNRETETTPCNNDVDSKCESNTHLSDSQTSMVSDECLKNTETEEEGTLTHLGSQEPKADHLKGANVLPTETRYQYNVITATHDKSGTETAPPNNDVDSKCDSNTHLLGQTSMVSEEYLKNSETDKEGKSTHLGSQELKADHREGGAVSANVLPTETRLVSEKGDGVVKTGENSSAWSNIISFAKEFAKFWRKG